MCGIFGAFRCHGSERLEEREWQRTSDAMRRRGPDAAGMWSNSRALLGARRLAIMDPRAAADMPMRSWDDRFLLVFNGELYAHDLHRGALAARGWTFTTASDTETVLAAIAIHGPDVLDDLNGMFALCFYDALEHRLLLARDHAGIKPLYASQTGGSVAFCSEFDTLLESPAKIPLNADPVALVQYLDFGHVFAPRSLIRNVESLEPGERRQYFADGTCRRAFDRLRREHSDYFEDQEAEEALSASMRAAVVRQSRSDSTVGYLLSGGIDSRLLANLGAEIASEPIRTFSVGNEDPFEDERAGAAAEARLLNANHSEIDMYGATCQALFEDAVSAMHEPVADEGILPTLLVSQLASSTVRVVLSGEGADELLFGYSYRHGTASWSETDSSAPTDYLNLYREFTHADFNACFPSACKFRADTSPAISWTAESFAPMEWMRRIELHTYLPFVLMKTDRASMFHSIEARVPYLDKEVIRTALRIRPRVLYDAPSNCGKLLSRTLLERRGRPANGPKRGFTAPVEHWLRGPLRPALETTLARLAGFSSLPLEPAAIRRLARDHCACRIDAGMALWRILILDHWAARVGV